MESESSLRRDESPAIASRVEKATEAYFHKISRVVVEVKEPGDGTGFRKLGAISLDGWPPHARTSEQEDELNVAIMQVAMAHVEETGESNRFRARYVGGPDGSGRPLRKYACFKVSADDDDAASKGPLLSAMPGLPAGFEAWVPVVRWLMSMLEAREQQLMAYNETLTVKLLESAAQAEPLLNAHGAMSGILEQAVVLLRETLLANGGAAEGAPLLAGQDGGDTGALQQVVTAALLQFFTNGKMPPPPMPGVGVGGPEAPPPGPRPRPPSASHHQSEAPGAPASGIRFGFDAKAKPDKAEAVEGALVRAVRTLFGRMDGLHLLTLTDALGAAHYEGLCAVRTATTDAEAAQAVAAMQRAGGWDALREHLTETETTTLAEIEALVRRHAPSPAPKPTGPERARDTEQLLVKSVQSCLGAMDGDRAMALSGQLSMQERELLHAVRVAQTDDAASRAVMAFGAALEAAGKVSALVEALTEPELAFFKHLYAQAAGNVEEVEGEVESGAEPVRPSPRTTKPSRTSERVEAVLCLPPTAEEGPLMQATQAWLKGMSGEAGMALLSMLTPLQREGLQEIRTARTEGEAARAVLAFQAALMRSANWMGLISRLGQEHLGALLQIQSMAQEVLGSS